MYMCEYCGEDIDLVSETTQAHFVTFDKELQSVVTVSGTPPA